MKTRHLRQALPTDCVRAFPRVVKLPSVTTTAESERDKADRGLLLVTGKMGAKTTCLGTCCEGKHSNCIRTAPKPKKLPSVVSSKTVLCRNRTKQMSRFVVGPFGRYGRHFAPLDMPMHQLLVKEFGEWHRSYHALALSPTQIPESKYSFSQVPLSRVVIGICAKSKETRPPNMVRDGKSKLCCISEPYPPEMVVWPTSLNAVHRYIPLQPRFQYGLYTLFTCSFTCVSWPGCLCTEQFQSLCIRKGNRAWPPTVFWRWSVSCSVIRPMN